MSLDNNEPVRSVELLAIQPEAHQTDPLTANTELAGVHSQPQQGGEVELYRGIPLPEVCDVCDANLFASGLCFGVLPSMYDVTTDVIMIHDFMHGAYYIKTVSNTSAMEGCDFISNQTTRDFSVQNDWQTTNTFTYNCFETDHIFGWVSLVILFLPSLYLLQSKQFNKAAKIIFIFTFPLALLIVKTVEMFTTDKKWQKRSVEFGTAEGRMESKNQLMLQIFIVFTMANRQPSYIQVASMLGSIIMITKLEIEEHVFKIQEENPSEPRTRSLEQSIGYYSTFIPYFLTKNLAASLTMSLLVALLRYNSVWVLIFLIIARIMEKLVNKYTQIECSQCLSIPLRSGSLTMDFAHLILYNAILIIFVILANVNYDPVMSTFSPFFQETYTLSSMPIVSDINRFNMLTGFIFLIRSISYALWYFQIRCIDKV